MPNVFIRKLEGYGPIGESDKELLLSITAKSRRVEQGVDLIREGDRPNSVHLVMDGFAFRYKLLPDGGRQIIGYLIPGDFCDLNIALLEEMDHNIGTLTPCQIVEIPRRTILDLTENHPPIARALWWTSLVDEAVLREWMVNIGQRSAPERIAHLFCELQARMAAVGLITDGEFELPISQQELGDTVGLSAIHVNRSLKILRDEEYVSFRSRSVVITDIARLQSFSGFHPRYLHLVKRSGDAR